MLEILKNYKKLTMTAVVAMMMATNVNATTTAYMRDVRVLKVGVSTKNEIYANFSLTLMRSCRFKNFDFLVKRDRGNILKALLYAKSHRERVDIEYEPSTTPYRVGADCKLPIIKMVILK